MDPSKNLSDPAFEPSDEDLIGLARRAFAHVRADQEAAARKLRAEIAVARAAAMGRLQKRRAQAKTSP